MGTGTKPQDANYYARRAVFFSRCAVVIQALTCILLLLRLVLS